MKINYSTSRREYISCLNKVNGFLLEKRKWNKDKTLKTFSQLSIRNYILCFLFIPLIAIFDTFTNLDSFTFFLALCLILLLGIQTIRIIIFLLQAIKRGKNSLKGELTIDEDGITDQIENRKPIFRKWREIKHILIHDDVILIYTHHGTNLFIPNKSNVEKKVIEQLEKLKKDKLIVDVFTYHGLTKNIQVWGKYLLVVFILFGIAVFWDYYNISLIDEQVWKINNSGYEEIDEHIFSYQKFGIVEKTLKEYFKEFYNSKEQYFEYEATAIYSKITIELLKDHPDQLTNMLNDLPMNEELATKAVKNIVSLLNEDEVMERIRKKNLGVNYENTFKDYALMEEDATHMKNWQKELDQNTKKMSYVKRALEILVNERECWYVENDTFYMCDDYLDEYNQLYNYIIDVKNKEDQII